MTDDLEELKRKVRIEEVSAQLGYKVNTKAGTRGSYLEVQLFAGDQKADTIVIRRGRNGNVDTYFHRSTGSGGSVADFVRENLAALGFDNGRGWKDVIAALRHFAGLPTRAFIHEGLSGAWQESRPPRFDPTRFEVSPIEENIEAVRMILAPRAITDDTLEAFAPWISLIRDTESAYAHPSLGFPYREPGRETVVGYEIRGYGSFKGKAAGTNSTTAAWIVSLAVHPEPLAVRRVYFAESAYDIMSLWQRNRLTIDREASVFVSTGGQLSAKQVSGIMAEYPRARLVDCFDNDLAGRVYGIRAAAIVSGISLDVVQTGDSVHFNANGKRFDLPKGEVSTDAFAREVPLLKRYEQCLPPRGYKDWNDVVRGHSTDNSVSPSKYQRDERLRQRRLKGIKL